MNNITKSLLSLTAGLLISVPALAAETFTIDPVHSTIGFTVKHMMVSNVTGNFGQFEGTVAFDANDLAGSTLAATIKTDSVDTRNKQRDDHLKSADFFDAAKNPEITFVSKSLTGAKGEYNLTGDLTIKGITKEVSFPVSIAGPVTSPFGGEVVGVTGQFKLNRLDYGVTFNKTLDNGGVLVSNDVIVVINIEAKK